MRTFTAFAATLLVAAACSTAPRPAAPPPQPAASSGALVIPVESYKLGNGLRVVVSPDRTLPQATVAVYYGVGLRLEPKDRTGFAHLFEHLMFDGSRNLPKGEMDKLVQANGGGAGGSTRFDYTNYYTTLQSNAVEMLLWAEADRMKGLELTDEILKTEQDIVKNEVRVNVLNAPYGGFPWIDVPMAANVNWHNAHNFYGELGDLEAASLTDVRSFFDAWYAPNNAVLAVTGDVDPAEVRRWVEKYFGGIPRRPDPPPLDISEPRQTAERRGSRVDPKANRPALSVAWHAPDTSSRDYMAMVLIEQILTAGRDSWLFEDLVQKRGMTANVSSTLNGLGNAYTIKGPTLYTTWLYHDKTTPADDIVRAIDASVERLRTQPIDAETLARAKVKARADFYRLLESGNGFGRADLLASFSLFWDDPARINRLESEIAAVTAEQIRRVAEEYLRPANRTIYSVLPKE